MKLSERIRYEINTNPKLPPSIVGVAATLEGIAEEVETLESTNADLLEALQGMLEIHTTDNGRCWIQSAHMRVQTVYCSPRSNPQGPMILLYLLRKVRVFYPLLGVYDLLIAGLEELLYQNRA